MNHISAFMAGTYAKSLLGTITPDQYAEAVVNEVLKPSPAAWFWHGPTTTTVRWCDMLLPRTFWVSNLFACRLTKALIPSIGLAVLEDVRLRPAQGFYMIRRLEVAFFVIMAYNVLKILKRSLSRLSRRVCDSV